MRTESKNQLYWRSFFEQVDLEMIRELNFRFQDLNIDYQRMAHELGYSSGKMPDAFVNYLEKASVFSEGLDDIKASCRILRVDPEVSNERYIQLEDAQFKVGKTIAKELKNSQQAALFIITAGKTITVKAEQESKSGNSVYGRILTALSKAILNALEKEVFVYVRNEASKREFKTTNCYCPGYCHWDLADQHQLFALFGNHTCGVSLTASASMIPERSISGIIGLGKHVQYREYHCTLCEQENCIRGCK